jgi:cysteine-rich repeat protein
MRHRTCLPSLRHRRLLTASLMLLLAARGALAAMVGPNPPGTVVSDASFGTSAWTNPMNAIASDDMYTVTSPGGSPTQYLKATDFAFALPGAATVNGITVAIERHSAAGLIHDARVRIVKGGVIGATDRALGGNWPTSDAIATYGGASDLWGETWTPADVNGAGFGVALSVADNVDAAGVDQITVTISYSLCGNGLLEPGEQCDDSNTMDGDCCSSTCQFESNGSPCAADANPCTADVCDGAGSCTHPPICTDHPITGAKLVISKAPNGKQKASFTSKDTTVLFPTPSGSNDPRFGGATVDLFSGNEGTASFDLPAVDWGLNGSQTIYKFKNKLAPGGNSEVRISTLKKGRGLKISSRATGLPLTGPQGHVGIRFRTGLERSCALFGPSTITRDEANKFQAKNATTAGLTDCSDASLSSPSGAFLGDRSGF